MLNSEKAEVQCTIVKREIYKLRDLLKELNHEEHRNAALGMCDNVYDLFDRLQQFVISR